jgi:hypothetical protein
MVWDYEATVRRIAMPQDDMAAALSIALVTELLEDPDGLSSGDAR